MKKVLLYGLEEEESSRIQGILAKHDIATYILNDEVLEETVEKAFDLEDDTNNSHTVFEEAFFICQELTLEELLNLLKEIEADGKEFDGIKIMRTENNASWTLRDLMFNAKEEYEAARKAIILEEMIRNCDQLDLSSLNHEEMEEFKENLMSAFITLKSGDFTNAQITREIDKLKESMKKVKRLLN